jgi:phage-related minor tail protein
LNAQLAAAALEYGKIQNTGEGGADQAAREAIARLPNPFGRVASGAGGPARSMATAQKQSNDLQREAAQVFEKTRTESEKYAIEVDKLNRLLAAGGISQDTFNRAIDGLKEKAGEAAGAATQLESSFQGAFASFVTGASSAQDAVASLLQDLAGMLANRAFQSLMGAGGSGIFASIGKVLGFANGGALNGGRVQAFAAGGIVNGPTVFPMANGAGLMGEAGPEAIMPLTRIGGKLGVRAAGGGGSVVNIDARYATEGTAEMIVKAIQRAAPGIVKQSVSANRAAGARGY